MDKGYTPPQQRIFRAVAGAARNAAHGHPKWKISSAMVNSIAKRATGTLTAQWREVLAAGPSESCTAPGAVSAHVDPTTLRRRARGSSGGCTQEIGLRRSPLSFLHGKIGSMAGAARKAGLVDREQALTEVLRLIADQQIRVSSKSK